MTISLPRQGLLFIYYPIYYMLVIYKYTCTSFKLVKEDLELS